MIKRFLLFFSFVLIATGLLISSSKLFLKSDKILSPIFNEVENKILPLKRYEIESLKNERQAAKDILIGENFESNLVSSSYLFSMLDKQSSVSGLINIPGGHNLKGLIILIRGFVPREIFTSGTGTKRIGEFLSANGFVTIAPDFLGYGNSSSPSALPLEERFQTYSTLLSLLSSIPNLEKSIKNAFPEKNIDLMSQNIGLFGHSNGGHIALAILEITGKTYPTVLWAPVSKPFPFSILAYTDEYDDKGKALRKIISDFEVDYDIEMYSIDNYFDLINAPLSIHQGLNDIEVPYWWSDDFTSLLESKNKNFEYFKYPGEDHNFNQGTWETLADRTLNFYLKEFSKPKATSFQSLPTNKP